MVPKSLGIYRGAPAGTGEKDSKESGGGSGTLYPRGGGYLMTALECMGFLSQVLLRFEQKTAGVVVGGTKGEAHSG